MNKTQRLHTSLMLLGFIFLSFTYNESPDARKYNKLAKDARIEGDIGKSINYLLTGLSKCVNQKELYLVYNSLGACYYKLSDYHTAISYYDSAWAVMDSSFPADYFGSLYNNFGLINMQLEKFGEAIDFYKKASESIDKKSKGLVYFNIAKCYGYLNNTKEETRFYNLAYKVNKSTYGKVNFYTVLAGLELVERGSNLLDELYPAIKELDNKQLNGYYFSLVGDYEKAELYFNTNNRQLLKFYVKTNQWIKAVSVIDSLRNSYLSLDSKLFLQANEMFIYKNAVDFALKKDKRQALIIAQKSYANILKELSGHNLSTTKNAYNYFDFDSVIYLFLNDQKGIEFYKIEADKEFWDNYNLFKASFTLDSNFKKNYYHNYQAFCYSANYLYEKLIPKVEEDILIVATGKIQYIAFECLLPKLPDDMDMPNYKTLPYLVKTSSIHYDYILREHEPEPHRGRKRIMALAPDSSLKFSHDEIETLRPFRGKRLHCTDAKLKYIFEGDVLHISTHYNPVKYSISFADSIFDIDKMKELTKEMVVLSMCQSGEGKYYYGEGIFSPARAFYLAGAKSVIESLWNASDQSSFYIMGKFYRQLFLGKDKATALRNAKMQYLEFINHRFSHPYYWANYRVFGNNNSIKLAIHPVLPPIVICLILLAVIFLKYLLSRKRIASLRSNNSS